LIPVNKVSVLPPKNCPLFSFTSPIIRWPVISLP
jgi:hypothetical protein